MSGTQSVLPLSYHPSTASGPPRMLSTPGESSHRELISIRIAAEVPALIAPVVAEVVMERVNIAFALQVAIVVREVRVPSRVARRALGVRVESMDGGLGDDGRGAEREREDGGVGDSHDGQLRPDSPSESPPSPGAAGDLLLGPLVS